MFKSNSFLGLHDKSMRKHRRASSVPRGAGRGWRVDPDFKFWWNQRNPQLTFGVVSQRILIYHGNIGQASASPLLSSCMTAGRLGVRFVRNVIQEAILAIEAEIDERKGLISKLRKLGVRPAAVDRADGVARPKWSAARRKRFNATWAKKKAAKAKGA